MNFSVPDICDQFLPQLQILEPRFRPYGGRLKFSGEIVTIKCFEDNSLVKRNLAKDGTGKVMVVDGGGSLHCALLGDMLGAMAAKNGWQGLVINGCVRDVEILKTIDIGVSALNSYPIKSEKLGMGELNIPIHFAGVDFEPGHYIYADENGMVVARKKLSLHIKEA